MKKLNKLFVILSVLLFTTNIFAQVASATWALNNTTQLTSASAGNVTGSAETKSSGSGQFGMSVFDYSSDGQRLWEGTAGWITGTEEAARYIQFNALPANGNSFTVSNVSFNYGAAGIDHNIQSNAYYSTDGWVTRTLLNPGPLEYPGSAMTRFTQNVSVTVASGTTFSVRIYPYAVVNSSPMRPTFAVHNNVVISGTTVAKKNCVIQVTNIAGKWGKSVLLTARLQEIGVAGNTNLPGRKVSMGTRESDTCDCPLSEFINSGTTDANGVASIAYTIPQDSVSSSMKAPQDSVAHTIKAEFAGDADYNAQSSTGKLIVIRHVASLTVTPTTAIFGQPVVFSATLIDNDNDGKGVSNQELKFYKISPGTREGDTARVYVGSGTTNSSGVASISYTLPQDSVISSISVSFAGDANYSPKSGTGKFTKTLKNYVIEVVNAAGKWGKPVVLTARLQEPGLAGNSDVPNQELKFYKISPGTREGDTARVYINSGTTNASGIASISYTIPQDSATHSISLPQDSVANSIRAEFAGDANYNAQSGTGTLTVVRHVTTLSIKSHSGGAGKVYTQDLALTDNDNSRSGISNQVLKFYIDKAYVKSGTTNASGVTSISFTLPQDSVSHSISASFVGDANYSPQSNTGTITYTLKNSIIQITEVAGKWGKSILLTARLQEPGLIRNTDLPNQELKFYKISPGTREGDTVEQKYVGSGITNASGIASFMYAIPQDSVSGSISFPQDSIAHTIKAEFAGDANYSAQNGMGTLTVVRHVTSISVPIQSGVYGQPVVLVATLMDNDNDGKGVSNQELKFYKISPGTREGDTTKVYVGSGTTDASGVGIWALVFGGAAEGIIIMAEFSGDANYSPKSGTGKFTITVVGVEKNQMDIPTKFDLLQNYPNPFNPTSTIRYDIPKTGLVNISVYDILGREIRVLVNEEKNPGHYEIIFDAKGLASGIYFYTIKAIGFTQSKKMILMK